MHKINQDVLAHAATPAKIFAPFFCSLGQKMNNDPQMNRRKFIGIVAVFGCFLAFSSIGFATDKPIILTHEQEAIKQKVAQMNRVGANFRKHIAYWAYFNSIKDWGKLYQTTAAPLIAKYGTEEDKKVATDIEGNADKLLKEYNVCLNKYDPLFEPYNDAGLKSTHEPTNKKLYEDARKKMDDFYKVMDETGPAMEFNGLCVETWHTAVTAILDRMTNGKLMTDKEMARLKKEWRKKFFPKFNKFDKPGALMRYIDAIGPVSPIGVEFLKNRAADVEKSGRPLSAVEQQLLQKFAGMPVQVAK